MNEKYQREQVVLEPLKANLYSIFFSIAFFIAALLLYGGDVTFTVSIQSLSLFLLLVIAGIVVHECLHGIGFLLSREVSFSDIRFGFVPKKLVFYCCCPKPIAVSRYRFAVLLPGLILGLVPFCLSLRGHSLFWYLWSFFMIAGSFGDVYILWTLRKYDRQTLISDSVDSIGYDAYIPVEDGDVLK